MANNILNKKASTTGIPADCILATTIPVDAPHYDF